MKDLLIIAYLAGSVLWMVLHAIAWLREFNWREDWPVLIAVPFFICFFAVMAMAWPALRCRERQENENWFWSVFA